MMAKVSNNAPAVVFGFAEVLASVTEVECVCDVGRTDVGVVELISA